MTAAKNLPRFLIVFVTVFLGAATSTLLQVFVLQEETPLFESAISGALTGGVAGLVAGLLLAFTFVRPEKNAPDGQAPTTRKEATSALANCRLLIWGFALGAVAGLLIQIIRLTGRPQEFRSLAKVVAVQGLDPEIRTSAEVSPDYYGTIIETLESSQTKAAAMKRVKALNPESKILDVDLRVAQTRGSAIFNVLATGSEPQYTRALLDALLDEFMFLRARQAESAGLDPRRDVAIQERATPAAENVEDWSMPLLAGTVAGAWLGTLLGLVAKLLHRSREVPPQGELAS